MQTVIEILSKNKNAPIIMLFEASTIRRHQIIELILELAEVTVFGSLDDAQGMAKLETLKRLDLLIIGSKFTICDRKKIKNYVITNFPKAQVTEPGFSYTYNLELIRKDVKSKLNII